MRMLALALMMAALPVAAQQRAFPTPYCTDINGTRIELGGLTCIAPSSCVEPYLARCDMSQNSPMWRKVQDGCPAVSAEPPALPQTPIPERPV
jgi:hypothetical protein